MSFNSTIKRKPTAFNTAEYKCSILKRIDHLKISPMPRDFALSRHSNPSPYVVYIGPEFASMLQFQSFLLTVERFLQFLGIYENALIRIRRKDR